MNLIRSVLHVLWLILTVIPWALFVVVASYFVSSTQVYWFCAGWLKLAVGSGTFILGIQNRVTGMEICQQALKILPFCWSNTNPRGRPLSCPH